MSSVPLHTAALSSCWVCCKLRSHSFRPPALSTPVLVNTLKKICGYIMRHESKQKMKTRLFVAIVSTQRGNGGTEQRGDGHRVSPERKTQVMT